MVRGVRWYLVGSLVLGGLAVLSGCSGRFFTEQREPWRHEAELSCLNSGAVREGEGKVRIKPINGPGMCGADFPLKVSALGDSAPLAFFWGDSRPPAAIPNASQPGAMPRWPAERGATTTAPDDTYYDSQPVAPPPGYPRPAPVEARPLGAPPASAHDRRGEAPLYDQRGGAPLSLDPRGAAAGEMYDFRKPYVSPPPPAAQRGPLPALGPSRSPMTAMAGPVSVSPAATLACPVVSVLDQWIAGGVQPAAMRWFGQPITEIRQISAYSCRGMNGNPNARISEHAFGNALDIASFTFADGRRLTVEKGWHGTPEEQGFLRDVQATACAQFNTVLAPGSDVHHYNHIHVDLMRRAGGRRACNPRAVSGEEVAARVRGRYAGRSGDVTGSLPRATRFAPNAYSAERPRRGLPAAVPGDDGED
jgi:hypothetical protein